MNKPTTQKLFAGLFVLTLFFAFVGYVLANPGVIGLENYLCDWYAFGGEIKCGEKYNLSLGRPLYGSLPYISLPFLLIALLPVTYESWARFGWWALPVMLILVILNPTHGETFSPVPDRYQLAEFLAQVYLGISLIIIAYSWWHQKDEFRP